MSPVEHTSTASRPQPSSAATAAHIRSASSSPCLPVPALALPLLSTTAAARPRVAARWRLLTVTGAATTRFWVNTPAAATGAPSSVATSARSAAPSCLMPQATPAATNPAGATTVTAAPSGIRPSTVRPSGPSNALSPWAARFARSRVHPHRRQAGALGQVEHQVGALHRLARGPLDEVVEGGQRHHPPGAGVGQGGDVHRVGTEG